MPVDGSIRDKVVTAIGSYTLLEMFTSLSKDWGLLLLMVATMVVISLVVTVLIKLVAGYVVYILYGLALLAFVGFGIYMGIPLKDN